MTCPIQKHVDAAIRVIQYLYRTKEYGIRYCRSPPRESVAAPHINEAPTAYLQSADPVAVTLPEGKMHDVNEMATTYVDADLAGDVDTMRSTTGFTIMLHGGVVSCMCRSYNLQWCLACQKRRAVVLWRLLNRYVICVYSLENLVV